MSRCLSVASKDSREPADRERYGVVVPLDYAGSPAGPDRRSVTDRTPHRCLVGAVIRPSARPVDHGRIELLSLAEHAGEALVCVRVAGHLEVRDFAEKL